MTLSTEVVVIGGGLIGCSVAYYLTKEGVNVVLVERGELESGATKACQGGAPVHLLLPPLTKLALESQRLYSNLARELEYDIEYEKCGSFICIDRENQWPALERHAKKLQEQGVKVHLVDGDEARELEPALGSDIVGASICSEDPIMNPLKVCFGFARAAKRLGATINTFTEVIGINVRNKEIQSVITSKGKIKTDFVVDAAGPWSSFIGKMVGLDIPVKPRRGQIIVTEPQPLSQWRYILDAEYLVTESEEAIAKSKDPRIRLGVASSLIQHQRGNWTIGASKDFLGFDDQTTPETLTYLTKRAVKFLPKLRLANCIRTFAGLRPYPADGLPILGKADNVSGFIIATGHAGEGLVLSPITGKLISELITKNKTSIPIDTISYSRFENKKKARGP